MMISGKNMKFQFGCLAAVAISLAFTNLLHAQTLKESSDPYFQPKEPVARTAALKTTQPKSTFAPSTTGFQPKPQPSALTPATKTNNRNDFLPTGGNIIQSPAIQQVRDTSQFVPTPQTTTSQPETTRPLLPETGAGNEPDRLAAQNQNPAPKAESFEPTRVLARVGGQPIFVADLSVEAMQIVDKFMSTAPMSVKRREAKNILPRLLPKYIQGKLLLVDALESLPEGANVDDIYSSAGDQFDEMMVPQLMKNVNVESPAKLDAYYRALGSSLRNVRRSWIESELVKYMMRSKININPDVSHREMHEYYVENKDQYSVPAKVKWEQLMVRFDQFPNQDAARAALAEMGDEVVYGAPLAAVAKRSSQGFKASDGGQQGWTTRGSLVDKKLDDMLFNMEIGKLSNIVPTRGGLAIIRVIERQKAGFIPFEESQSEIKESLLSAKQDVEFQKHIANVKKRVPVEVFDPAFVAQNPETGKVQF